MDSDARLESMAAEAGAKPSIVDKLEKVRGLTKAIEGIGETVCEVSRMFSVVNINLILRSAASSHQGSMEDRSRLEVHYHRLMQSNWR